MIDNNVKVVERWPGSVFVKIAGRLDQELVSECESALKSQVFFKTKFITFDFTDVTYISSVGIRLILVYRKLMEGRGGKLVMVNVSGPIKKALEIASVLPSWGIFASVEEADAYFGKMQQKS